MHEDREAHRCECEQKSKDGSAEETLQRRSQVSRDFSEWNNEPAQNQSPNQAPAHVAKKLGYRDRIRRRVKRALLWLITLAICVWSLYWLFLKLQLVP
jgi:hypothetical protein